jgi:hypothetical protein
MHEWMLALGIVSTGLWALEETNIPVLMEKSKHHIMTVARTIVPVL